MRILILGSVVLAVFLCTSLAQAEGAVGWVSQAEGAASVATAGADPRPAEVKMDIAKEDVLATGPNGTMQVVFRDETILALGADSQLVILDALTLDGDGLFNLRFVQGAVRLLASATATKNADKFQMDLPLGSIGIRGTEFGVRVLPERSTVLLYEGGPVLFSTSGGAANQEACATLTKALDDAQTTLADAKEKNNGVIQSQMKRRISQINDLQTEAGCAPYAKGE
ncbi:MAG: FecR domain-containing protein [Proteobacteria bacterium]|nr:FecR domain-containing protein [Pseudomonadota bacterium]